MARRGGAVGRTGVVSWQDSAGSLSFPFLSGQTGWINHLQRCQHLPKQFQIGINGRWGCCSLCLISSTKCGFISYKMKPSVARRCKDQVREDGGRGWQREREEMGAFGACALFRKKRNETKRLWNGQNSESKLGGGKEKHLSIKKRGNVILHGLTPPLSNLLFPPHRSTTQGPSPLYQDPSISRHRGCNLVPKPQLRQTFLINLLVLKGDDSV